MVMAYLAAQVDCLECPQVLSDGGDAGLGFLSLGCLASLGLECTATRRCVHAELVLGCWSAWLHGARAYWISMNMIADQDKMLSSNAHRAMLCLQAVSYAED